MATQDGEDVQRAEKAALKRKLTGPPRLLLGKTRTRSVGEDGPEARTNRDQTGNTGGHESSAEADADAAELTEGSRGRCGAAGEDDDITNRKLNRRSWWRRFTPAVVCSRKQKTNVEESLAKLKNDHPAAAEAALQDAASPNTTTTEEDTENGSKGRRRFNVAAWMVFKRFRTSSRAQGQSKGPVETDGAEPSTTFRRKMRSVFSRGGKKSVPPENTEDTARREAPPRSAGAPVGSLQVVTVQLTEEGPDETPAEDQQLCDAGDGSESIRTDGEVVKDEVFCVSTAVVLDAEPETTSQSLLPPTNGPGIRIELVPPDNAAQEEEDCRVGGPASGSQNHLLLLLGLDHSERRLVQTARSLVRVAMNAAVEQLSREQQRESDGVHREPQGCKDHA